MVYRAASFSLLPIYLLVQVAFGIVLFVIVVVKDILSIYTVHKPILFILTTKWCQLLSIYVLLVLHVADVLLILDSNVNVFADPLL